MIWNRLRPETGRGRRAWRPLLVAGAAAILVAAVAAAPASAAAPANDNFAAAQTLSGATGSVAATNVGATLEAGEPVHAGVSNGASVWFTWTSPGNGPATITTAGSSFDTILAVYTGSSLGALTAVASNDDSGGTTTSQVAFAATAGTTYRIAVAGYKNPATLTVATGTIALAWTGPSAGPPPPPPANDDFAAAQALTGSTGSVTGTNVGATLQAGEPQHAGVTDVGSVWYSWTSPGSGPATFNTLGSNFDTVLAVYTGSAVNALTELASNDDYPGYSGDTRHDSLVTFDATAGTTYRIAVAGFANGILTGMGAAVLSWTGPAATTPPPANDNFAAAQALSGVTGSVTGTNIGATLQPGEPQHAHVSEQASIWYSWTSVGTGPATFNTAGTSDFDPVLAVYTGTAVNALTELASNDDCPCYAGNNATRHNSLVTFNAVAGTTYRVAVAGFLGGHLTGLGHVVLNWTGPAAPPPFTPRSLLQDAVTQANGLIPGANKDDAKKLKSVVDKITQSLDGKAWIDDSHLTSRDGGPVFDRDKEAAATLMDLMKKSSVPAASLQSLSDKVVSADQILAQTALNEAIARGGKPGNIAAAQTELANAASDLSAKKYDSAIGHFKNAWQQAIGA